MKALVSAVLMMLLLAAAGPPSLHQTSPPPLNTVSTADVHDGESHAAKTRPLFVNGNCAKNRGSTDYNKGWWEKLWTDPVAFFTGILACFTIALSFATLRAANAAKVAANAVPVSERAYLYPRITSVNETANCVNGAAVWHLGDPAMDDVPSEATTGISFVITNHGRTPGILKELRAAFRVASLETAIEGHTEIPEAVLGATESTKTLVERMPVGLTRNQAEGIRNGTQQLSFWGKIIYEDIWGTKCETDFSFEWDDTRHRMVTDLIRNKTIKLNIRWPFFGVSG